MEEVHTVGTGHDSLHLHEQLTNWHNYWVTKQLVPKVVLTSKQRLRLSKWT